MKHKFQRGDKVTYLSTEETGVILGLGPLSILNGKNYNKLYTGVLTCYHFKADHGGEIYNATEGNLKHRDILFR